jgi:hypothetical protein
MCLPSGQPQRVAPTMSLQILKSNFLIAIVKDQYGMSTLLDSKNVVEKERCSSNHPAQLFLTLPLLRKIGLVLLPYPS